MHLPMADLVRHREPVSAMTSDLLVRVEGLVNEHRAIVDPQGAEQVPRSIQNRNAEPRVEISKFEGKSKVDFKDLVNRDRKRKRHVVRQAELGEQYVRLSFQFRLP